MAFALLHENSLIRFLIRTETKGKYLNMSIVIKSDENQQEPKNQFSTKNKQLSTQSAT